MIVAKSARKRLERSIEKQKYYVEKFPFVQTVEGLERLILDTSDECKDSLYVNLNYFVTEDGQEFFQAANGSKNIIGVLENHGYEVQVIKKHLIKKYEGYCSIVIKW